MKPKSFFFMFFIALILVIWGGLFYDATYIEIQAFNKEVKSHLASVSESRGERINDWLLDRSYDVKTLASAGSTKELLMKDLSSSELAVKLSIDKHSEVVRREVSNYIKANPGMTLKDLQNNEEFKSVAVSPIGESRYTFLINKNTSVVEFHHNPDMVGLYYDSMEGVDNEESAIFKVAQVADKDSFGFYSWEDSGGETKRKYSHFSTVPIKTLDGFEFILAIAAYVEDYKVIEGVSENISTYFNNFRKSHGYHNIIFISKDGRIVYMNQEMEGLGESLIWKESINTGLLENYILTKNSNNVSFFGPFARHHGEDFVKISVMAPVYNEQILLGYVAIIDEMNDVIEISTELAGLWETGEVYLVNKDAALISPLRFRHIDALTQSIKTENMEACIREIGRAKNGKADLTQSENEKKYYEFLNYKGDLTLGTYNIIPMVGWCLLTEISEEEILIIPINNQIKRSVVILFITMIIVLIFIFLMKIFLDKNYLLTKRGFAKSKGVLKN